MALTVAPGGTAVPGGTTKRLRQTARSVHHTYRRHLQHRPSVRVLIERPVEHKAMNGGGVDTIRHGVVFVDCSVIVLTAALTRL